MNIIEYGALTETYGGIESYIKNQIKELSGSELKFDFLVPNEKRKLAYEEYLSKKGCRIYRKYERWQNAPIGHFRDLYNFFRNYKGKYDIAIANYLDLQNINFLIMAKLFGLKTIAHSHQAGESRGWKKRILVHINRILIPYFADSFFACSDQAGKWMFGNIWQKYYGKRSFVINNAIDAEKFAYDEHTRARYRKKLGIENKIVFGHTGRLSAPKNQSFILDVFFEIYKHNENVVLLLVGDGILKQRIEKKIKVLGLENNVFLLGERLDIAEILQAMDYFIFPSEWEGLGISLIEAQCTGLRCFASDVIPKEAFVTDEIIPLPLSLGSVAWANKILTQMSYCREDKSSQIRIAGYDAKTSLNVFKTVLKNLYCDKHVN